MDLTAAQNLPSAARVELARMQYAAGVVEGLAGPAGGVVPALAGVSLDLSEPAQALLAGHVTADGLRALGVDPGAAATYQPTTQTRLSTPAPAPAPAPAAAPVAGDTGS